MRNTPKDRIAERAKAQAVPGRVQTRDTLIYLLTPGSLAPGTPLKGPHVPAPATIVRGTRSSATPSSATRQESRVDKRAA